MDGYSTLLLSSTFYNQACDTEMYLDAYILFSPSTILPRSRLVSSGPSTSPYSGWAAKRFDLGQGDNDVSISTNNIPDMM